jgi:septal ring factor EnvC (AmiA/AmiB activator)
MEGEKSMLQDMLDNADAWRARAENAEAKLTESLARFRELEARCKAAEERGNRLEAALGKAQAQLTEKRR